MKAAVLREVGKPVMVENDYPEPKLVPGGVIVKPIYSYVLNFAAAIVGGMAPMKPPVPLVLGPACVATVDSLADDVVGLTPGQVVFVGPWMTSQINDAMTPPDGLIQGWFHCSPTTKQLDPWKDGMWSKKALARKTNVYPVPAELLKRPKAFENLAMVNYYSIALGAIRRGECTEFGKTVLVNGATGQLGQCAVRLALAYGAKKVYAVSRSMDKLVGIYRDSKKFPQLEFVAATDAAEYPKMCCDAVIDFLGFEPTGEPTSQSIGCLVPGGILVVAGGVGGPVKMNYGALLGMELNVRGSIMYGPDAPTEVMQLMVSGQLILPRRTFYQYDLDRVRDAISHGFRDHKRTCLLRMNEPPEL